MKLSVPRLALAVIASALTADPAAAQYITTGGAVTESFDSFTGTGFTTSPSAGQLNSNAFAVTGWSDGSMDFGGSRTSGDYARGASSGGVSTGGFYAFTVAAGNVALGIQPGSSDFAPGSVYVKIRNDGAAFTGFDLSYVRGVFNDQNRSNSFNFSYAYSASNVTTATGVGSLTYTPVNTFTSTATADGAPAWSLATVNGSDTTTTVNTGEYIFLRWSSDDVGGSGSRDEFAIASFSFTPVPEPATVLAVSAVGLGLARLRRRLV